MIALDTNALVRFLVEDDEAQAAKATLLFEQTIEVAQQSWNLAA